MPKQVAVINDLSGFGRCSLTVAISVLSSMRVSPCPMPTAVLSAQTGYPSYYCMDLSESMPCYAQEWSKLQARFDGIYTGFVASEEQILHILEFVEMFQEDSTFLLVDPILGDDGITYDMFTERLLQLMKQLVSKAHYVTPNVTELCLLTDHAVEDVLAIHDVSELTAVVTKMGKMLLKRSDHLRAVIVTGLRSSHSLAPSIGNVIITEHEVIAHHEPVVGGSYSGTGDLFASIITGSICNGISIEEAVKLATRVIQGGIRSSLAEGTAEIAGINYEGQLSELWKAIHI